MGNPPSAPHYRGSGPSEPKGTPTPWPVIMTAVGLVLVLIFAITAYDSVRGYSEVEETRAGPPSTAAEVPAEECLADPLGCNSAMGATDGGTMRWLMTGPIQEWSRLSFAGDTDAVRQVLAGVLPNTGAWLPDGSSYEHNHALLDSDPQLLDDDPLQIRMELAQNARWDDGTPITVDDLIVTWMLAAGQESEHCTGCDGFTADPYGDIESIEAGSGDSQAIITYAEGVSDPEWFALFGADLAPGGIYPAHIAVEEGFLEEGADGGPEFDDPGGIAEYFEFLSERPPEFSGGPYRIDDAGRESPSTVTLSRNHEYGGDLPRLDQLILEEDSAEPVGLQLQDGDIDGAVLSPMTDFDDLNMLREHPEVSLLSTPGATQEQLVLNTDNEWLSDPVLRDAILQAIPIYRVNEAMSSAVDSPGMFTDASNYLLPPTSRYARDHRVFSEHGTGDVEAAREALIEEGYDYTDGELRLDGEPVGPLRLASSNLGGEALGYRDASLQTIQEHLDDLGIETEVETAYSSVHALTEGDFDIFQYGTGTPLFFTDVPYHRWHSEAGANYSGVDNEEIDALAEQMREADGQGEAAALLDELAPLVGEEAVVLPLAWLPQYVAVSADYAEVRPNPHSALGPAYNVGDWVETDAY